LISRPNLVQCIHLFPWKCQCVCSSKRLQASWQSPHKVWLSGRRYFNLGWVKTRLCKLIRPSAIRRNFSSEYFSDYPKSSVATDLINVIAP
jgi:hypothetical protein